jgi:hypothetical protein
VVNVALQIEQGQRLHAEAFAEGFDDLVEMRSGCAQRAFLDGPIRMNGEVAVEQLAGGDHFRSGGNQRNFSASGHEFLQGNPFRNSQTAAFDEGEGFVHFGALGLSLGFGHFAEGEIVASSLEAERAVVAVAFFADACHVRLLLTETPCKYPAGGKMAENSAGKAQRLTALFAVSP